MKIKSLIIGAVTMFISVMGFAQQNQFYCNPLPMPTGDGGNASGDVTVIEYAGKYYMYCTGGGAWVSSDFVNWEYHKVDGVPTAPDVAEYNGKFYMSGNSNHLFVADNPLGPFQDMGAFKNTGPRDDGWNTGFDTKFFVDDDNQPYLFWSGRGISGIYGVKLDPNDPTLFLDKPTHLFGFNPLHSWERYGEFNEYPTVAWIEGPWVIKRNGIYYLEYSASGTQWQSYAEGYYTATSPLGPYTYAANNPLLRKMDGLVNGTAHGCITQGPDGNWWQFYTIVLPAPTGGRRIGMDKVTFDEDGLMYCTVTDTPQPGPLAKVDPNAPKTVPVTVHKMDAMNALSKVSSSQEGFYPAFAVDNYAGTIWRPAADDKEPYIMVELSPATASDKVQYYTVDSFRIMMAGIPRRGFGAGAGLSLYKYKLEVSNDGETFTTVLDKTNNTITRDTIFETFKPVNCRFVKISFTEWPKAVPLGVIDFTVFGYPQGFTKEHAGIPIYYKLPLENM